MNNLEKAFVRLRREGWYCAWGLPCCQSCAWGDIPFEHEEGPLIGQEVDIEKVLFNHEQDIEEDVDYSSDDEDEEMEWDRQFCTSDELNNSLFCFDGSEQGLKNLKAAFPIFDECGIQVNWNGKSDSRIELTW